MASSEMVWNGTEQMRCRKISEGGKAMFEVSLDGDLSWLNVGFDEKEPPTFFEVGKQYTVKIEVVDDLE